MNNERRDVVTIFRQAATAMAAGILLILVGTAPQLAIIGFIFAIYSLILLVIGFLQIFPKIQHIPEAMKKFTDELTILFMVVSLYSIVRNWAAIIKTLNASTKSVAHSVLWIQSVSSYGIIIWFVVFFLAFVSVAVIDIFRRTSHNVKLAGFPRGLSYTLAMIIYVLGCGGIAQFGTVTFKLALFIPSLVITILSATYVLWLKDKIKKLAWRKSQPFG